MVVDQAAEITMTLFRAEGLTVSFSRAGERAVLFEDAALSLEEAAVYDLVGPSGSGKSTLLNILATLDTPTSGEVFLEGQSMKQIKGKNLAAFRREKLGFVFQDFNLLDTFTVRDNILLPLVLSRTPLAEMEQRLKPVVASLGIEPLLDHFPVEISGGEKQRTAVARAVITEPRLILADEPTGALDSHSSQQLLNIFDRLNEQGQTLLMVTHSSLAASHARRVLFIRDGKLFAELCRGDQSQQVFYDRITASLSMATRQDGESL